MSFLKKFYFKKASLEDKMFLARYLSLMLKSGISLPKALELLIRQFQKSNIKYALKEVLIDINKGKTIAESLEKHPNVFDNLFINVIKTGEVSGSLEDSLDILAEQLKKSNELRSRIIGAIIYPIFIIALMIIVSNFIVFFIFPKILKVYESLNIKIPFAANLLILFIKFITTNVYNIIIIVFIAIILIFIWSKTKSGKKFIDWLKINIPFLKNLTKQSYIIQFVRTFSSLLKSGMSTPKALETTAETINSIYYKNSILTLANEIREGKRLSEIISQFENLYPPIVEQIIFVGEETGQLSQMLSQLSTFMEQELYNTLDNLSKLIEPILMIILAIGVGFIAFATIQLIYASIQSISA